MNAATRLDNAEVRDIAEIIIAKNRHGTGVIVKVHWDAERVWCENLVRDQQ